MVSLRLEIDNVDLLGRRRGARWSIKTGYRACLFGDVLTEWPFWTRKVLPEQLGRSIPWLERCSVQDEGDGEGTRRSCLHFIQQQRSSKAVAGRRPQSWRHVKIWYYFMSIQSLSPLSHTTSIANSVMSIHLASTVWLRPSGSSRSFYYGRQRFGWGRSASAVQRKLAGGVKTLKKPHMIWIF